MIALCCADTANLVGPQETLNVNSDHTIQAGCLNNHLALASVMSLLGPSHCRYICLKHRVAILRPQQKMVLHRNLTT